METYGLIGKKLSHSFSKSYFENKFKSLGIHAKYLNFELADIQQIQSLIEDNPELKGLNVTIPYKKSVISLIDCVDPVVKEVGSVNTLKIERSGHKKLVKGFNTDVIGFEETLKPLLMGEKIAALILGTGGASNAVSCVLNKLNIPFTFISRSPRNHNQLDYTGLTPEMIQSHHLIINTTPVGMYPIQDKAPNIPYEYLEEHHILYDLIYNPEETLFLKKGRKKGCSIMNGLKMLELQAEASWHIWNV